MTEPEIALILQEARYGAQCPVSGDFDAAVRDAIMAGYRAGQRESSAMGVEDERGDPREGDPMTWLRKIVEDWLAGGFTSPGASDALHRAAWHLGLLERPSDPEPLLAFMKGSQSSKPSQGRLP